MKLLENIKMELLRSSILELPNLSFQNGASWSPRDSYHFTAPKVSNIGGTTLAQLSFHSTQGFQHRRRPTNTSVILKQTMLPTEAEPH
jgi:hypothetical protein